MSILWKWIEGKGFSREGKMKLFFFLNSLLFTVLGLIVWLVVSRFGLNTLSFALCFTGYSGFFIGFIGGYLYLCQK